MMSRHELLRVCFTGLLIAVGLTGCDLGKIEFDTGFEEDPYNKVIDADGDGVPEDQDCDDRDASIYPGAEEVCDGIDNDCDGYIDEHVTLTWYFDGDGDGYGDDLDVMEACGEPHNYVASGGDCDDTNPDANPGMTEVCDNVDNDCDGIVDQGLSQTWYEDADGDGFGNEFSSIVSCFELDGYVSQDTDCDDANSSIHPNAVEVCDGIDNDCDGYTDDGDGNLDMSTTMEWYADRDSDGYGDETTTEQACEEPFGYVGNDNDCDDYNSSINPGEREDCGDLIDNDCDGTVDDPDTLYLDADGDSYGDPSSSILSCEAETGYVTNDSDCDDMDSSVSPDGIEVCDYADNDCDGTTDEDDATDAATWFEDSDSDSYGNLYSTQSACTQPAGYVADDTDCDDSASTTNPGADEYCDGTDNDCDSTTDESDAVDAATWYADTDSDSYGDPDVSATACTAPSGYVVDNTDCADYDASSYPGAAEVCDYADNDCNGSVDEGVTNTYFADSDGDSYGDIASSTDDCTAPSGYTTNSSDCDDADAATNPAATEVCDYADNDCDGSTDEGVTSTFYVDSDGDTYGDPSVTAEACSEMSGYTSDNTDCDDTDASISPAGYEYEFVLDPDSPDYLTEVGSCNDSVDGNCDGNVDSADWYCQDDDGDGFVNAVDPYQIDDSDSDGRLEVCAITENLYEPNWAYEDVYYQETTNVTSLSSGRTMSQTSIDVSGETVSALCFEPTTTGRIDLALVSYIGADGYSSVDTSNCSDWMRPLEDVCNIFFDGHCSDLGGVSDGCISLGYVGLGFYYDGSGAVSPVNE